MRRIRRIASRIAARAASMSIVLATPRAVEACSVCSAGASDSSQSAFFLGSLFLSLLPLALIGGVALFLVRRARQIAADEAAGVIRRPLDSPRPVRPV